jgi:pyruvate formate lyase activating enzyme
LQNIFLTNGFIGAAALRQMAMLLDPANVDLKCFTDVLYRRISAARLRPILEAIRLYQQFGARSDRAPLAVVSPR